MKLKVKEFEGVFFPFPKEGEPLKEVREKLHGKLKDEASALFRYMDTAFSKPRTVFIAMAIDDVFRRMFEQFEANWALAQEFGLEPRIDMAAFLKMIDAETSS